MEAIARPHQIVDAAEAKALDVRAGDIRFEAVSFHYGRDVETKPEAGTGPTALRRGGVINDLTCTSGPAKRWGW